MTAQDNWHWPHFAQVLCGSMSDRERLGLPDHYQPGPLDAAIEQATRDIYGSPAAALQHCLLDNDSPLANRIAAGNVLALLGDGRISVLDPAMCDIPGGEVMIGLAPAQLADVMRNFAGLGLDQSWIAKECPRHCVVLRPFRLARYPVTNQEYRAFLQATGYPELPSSWHFRRYPHERSNHPVYNVSPQAADAYAAWLSATTGRAFRLPTEAEWEWAASGPDGLEFPWGNVFDAHRANTAETGLFRSSSVGTFRAGDSPFGVADMAGNVEEYVADHYAAYPGGDYVADHLVEIHGQYRVARGGSFARFRDLARTRRRHGHNPRSATYAMGFRLAETI